jgi:hypothetical protein
MQLSYHKVEMDPLIGLSKRLVGTHQRFPSASPSLRAVCGVMRAVRKNNMRPAHQLVAKGMLLLIRRLGRHFQVEGAEDLRLAPPRGHGQGRDPGDHGEDDEGDRHVRPVDLYKRSL